MLGLSDGISFGSARQAFMALYQHSVTVPESAIDFLGHVNNLHYLAWMVEAAAAHSTHVGWPSKRYVEMGAGFVVRSHQIEYLAPAFAGDELIVHTWIHGLTTVRSLRSYRITRSDDEKLIATGQTVWSYVNFETQFPTRIPEEVASCFQVDEV